MSVGVPGAAADPVGYRTRAWSRIVRLARQEGITLVVGDTTPGYKADWIRHATDHGGGVTLVVRPGLRARQAEMIALRQLAKHSLRAMAILAMIEGKGGV